MLFSLSDAGLTLTQQVESRVRKSTHGRIRDLSVGKFMVGWWSAVMFPRITRNNLPPRGAGAAFGRPFLCQYHCRRPDGQLAQ